MALQRKEHREKCVACQSWYMRAYLVDLDSKICINVSDHHCKPARERLAMRRMKQAMEFHDDEPTDADKLEMYERMKMED